MHQHDGPSITSDCAQPGKNYTIENCHWGDCTASDDSSCPTQEWCPFNVSPGPVYTAVCTAVYTAAVLLPPSSLSSACLLLPPSSLSSASCPPLLLCPYPCSPHLAAPPAVYLALPCLPCSLATMPSPSDGEPLPQCKLTRALRRHPSRPGRARGRRRQRPAGRR